MDAAFKVKQENPRNRANVLSKLFFAWIVPLVHTGTKRLLNVQDLYQTSESEKSKNLGDKLEKKWQEEMLKAKEKNCSPSLLRAITNIFFREYILYGSLLFALLIFFRSPQPLVLSWFISQFEENAILNKKMESMYVSAGALVSMTIMSVFSMHHSIHGNSCVGMKVRIAISSLVNRKIMKLNQKSFGQTAAGYIINLLSNDCQRFDLVCIYLHYLWIMPFQIVLITYFLYRAVGISCCVGIFSMALCTLPLQGYLGKVASTLRSKTAERTDSRVKLMSQIISGIQVIKMYAWEKPFEKLIELLRLNEIDVLTKANYLRGFYLSCMVFIERSTLCLTLVCFTLLGNQLQSNIVFSMAQFFNILQAAMAIMYPMAISIGAESLVSIRRIEEFLVLDEREESSIRIIKQSEIIVNDVSASWIQGNVILNNINLFVPKGCLCAVIGPVGAGKSSLLQLLLGELTPTTGNICLGGKLSYSSQEPWLFAASVRKNILFGKEYDLSLYKEITKVCALKKDFEQLPYGDKTMVGERGVSLSGGQRARINLARAIYRQADVYLLDDPLSAVDTHVGKHLFQKCIVNYLKGTTRILVTHQLQYLRQADLIVVLNEGKIAAMGTFRELSNADLDLTKLLASSDETNEDKDKEKKEKEFSFEQSFQKVLLESNNKFEETVRLDEKEEEIKEAKGQSPLWDYVKSVRSFSFVTIVIFALILSQAGCTCCDLWVAFWTSQEELRHSSSAQSEVYFLDNNSLSKPIKLNSTNSNFYYSNNDNSTSFLEIPYDYIFDQKLEIDGTTRSFLKTNVAMYFYGAIIITIIVLTCARSLLFFKAAMKASKNIHSEMFHCLLKAPMRFFDVNPSGRVLNRFSKDIGAIDEILPRVLMEAIQIILVMVGILVVVTISNYYILAAIILLGATFWQMKSWFVASARSIKHLEGVAKSPVFSHISSSLRGLTTIRAFQAEEALIREFDDHQDVHTSAWYLTIACSMFFGLWLDLICVAFIACVSFGFVISANLGQMPASSMVGLALSQSLILTGMLQYGMKQTAEVINQLTSVERVLEYTKLAVEGPFDTPKGKLPVLSWPSLGKIEFKNLSLSYVKEEDPVLKNLNIIINSGEKVGIVGRTGAGKSSLITALFRLSPIEGSILIDDLDTKTVGLTDLRKKLSIIPQEPVLFSASLRYNLDPFNEFDDDQMWTALEEVELKDLVTTLDFEVSEGGSNFSLGQRQLLCLARALLRNNKILVLDEATANVDAMTDSLIQTTIRKKFKNCTVITIAHRLNTIMDSDKVVVMDSGRIIEFDHPHKLLQITDGHFLKMVLETGSGMTEQLKNMALNAWKERDEEDIRFEKFDMRF